ncbi:hypothetical protein KPL70_018086 [Citrus sinensis]|nr:hypothetical protein KPL70_018086 [Citrus sinensis]
MQFIYVLPGCEYSTHDMRVLRDTLTRRNDFKGHYYLVDTGYTNGNSFLAPFRGQLFHLSDYHDGHQPTTPAEFFNMRHLSARNVIERCFGLLKKRLVVLKSLSFYDIKTRHIIYVYCMLHNFIRREMTYDNMKMYFDDEQLDEWTTCRENLAQEMWNTWNASRKA